jgi:hypothetical protein
MYFGVEPDLFILTIDKLIKPPVFLNLRASVNAGAFFVFIRVGNFVNLTKDAVNTSTVK